MGGGGGEETGGGRRTGRRGYCGPTGEAVKPLSSGNTPFPFFKIRLYLQSHSIIGV